MHHPTTRRKIKFLFLLMASSLSCHLFAQNLDYTSKTVVTLNDGTPVTLYAQTEGSGMNAKAGKNYYYLK